VASQFVVELLSPKTGIIGISIFAFAVTVWRIVAHRSKMEPKLVVAQTARKIVKRTLTCRRRNNGVSIDEAKSLLSALEGLCSSWDGIPSEPLRDQQSVSTDRAEFDEPPDFQVRYGP
jgi:hypothetical protein